MAREPEELAARRSLLGDQLAAFRTAANVTQGQLAKAAFCDRTTVSHIEAGRARGDEQFWRIADERCQANGALLAAHQELEAAKQSHSVRQREAELVEARAKVESFRTAGATWSTSAAADDDEQEALELIRRINASDVGGETLDRLEDIVDELAIAYPRTPPQALLIRVRQHLVYVNSLLDARKTLAEHSRLLTIGAWLSLLGATLHVDLKQSDAATARLKTAASLADHVGHDELRGWCYETEAWRVLIEGDYVRALELSQAAQRLAPAGSSVAIQATAQEGRARARLGQRRETYVSIAAVQKLVSPLQKPSQSEHHYRYDPDKSVAYTATTLAWVGDPAAEGYAREVIRRLSPNGDADKWPRRVATANIDLSLALLVSHRPDEACDHTLRAITSGRVVPSNQWRAAEVVRAVESEGLPEAADLREAYEEMRRQ